MTVDELKWRIEDHTPALLRCDNDDGFIEILNAVKNLIELYVAVVELHDRDANNTSCSRADREHAVVVARRKCEGKEALNG